jgi:DNA-directed RNA polymerase specialized sigma24 family protein
LTQVELAYKKHKKWIAIVRSFGCEESFAEDIVQEMYIRLIEYEQEGLDIFYDQDINYYYCYKMLKGFYVDYLRKKKITKVNIDNIQINIEEEDTQEFEENFERNRKAYEKVINEVYWYDRKIFEIIASGKSIAMLSRETDISYYSLYNTFNNIKRYIKKELDQ